MLREPRPRQLWPSSPGCSGHLQGLHIAGGLGSAGVMGSAGGLDNAGGLNSAGGLDSAGGLAPQQQKSHPSRALTQLRSHVGTGQVPPQGPEANKLSRLLWLLYVHFHRVVLISFEWSNQISISKLSQLNGPSKPISSLAPVDPNIKLHPTTTSKTVFH